MNLGSKVRFEFYGKRLCGEIVEVLNPGQIPTRPEGNAHFIGQPVAAECCVVKIGTHFYLVKPIEFL